jgi:hypothetical protein
LSVTYRVRTNNGQQTNLLAINWDGVRSRAKPCAQNRAVKMNGAQVNLTGAQVKMTAPNKESPSSESSLESNTTTTTALPHAPVLRAPHTEAAPTDSNEHKTEVANTEVEEEKFRKLVRECRQKIPNAPRLLEEALRAALAAGVTLDELWHRCGWFYKHWHEWPAEHRPGAFYTGLAEAQPGMRPQDGWPYR